MMAKTLFVPLGEKNVTFQILPISPEDFSVQVTR